MISTIAILLVFAGTVLGFAGIVLDVRAQQALQDTNRRWLREQDLPWCVSLLALTMTLIGAVMFGLGR